METLSVKVENETIEKLENLVKKRHTGTKARQ